MPSEPPSAAVLDPWGDGVLSKALPSLSSAVSGATLREHLQVALLGPPSNGRVIEELAPTKAMYLPGGRYMVRYRALISGGDTSTETQLIGNVFSDANASRSYFATRLAPLARSARGRTHVPLVRHPAAHLEPLNMTVSVFPLDGELPTLLDATDPDVMLDVLRTALAEAGAERVDADRCRVDLARYGRLHRCVLRYTLTAQRPLADGSLEMTVYGKVASDGRGAPAASAISALHEHLGRAPEPPMRIPRSLGFVDGLGLQLLGNIPGRRVIRSLLDRRIAGRRAVTATAMDARPPTLEQAIDAAGTVAAAIHGSGVQLGPERSIRTELSAIGADRAMIRSIDGDLGDRFDEWIRALSRHTETSEPVPLALAHGDFTPSQLLFDGGSPGLVDFDTICRADPGLDLGRFQAYLRLAGARSANASGSANPDLELDRLCDRFLHAYVTARGMTSRERIELAERVRIFEILALLRIAARSWRKLEALRLDLAAGLIQARLTSLERRG